MWSKILYSNFKKIWWHSPFKLSQHRTDTGNFLAEKGVTKLPDLTDVNSQIQEIIFPSNKYLFFVINYLQLNVLGTTVATRKLW